MLVPKQGKLLVSNPFLKDPNFLRSVILICEKDEAGSLGFILNKRFEQNLNDIVELKTKKKIPVFYGGPVYTDNLYFLHNRPDLISDSIEVLNDIFWGGNFEEAIAHVNNGSLTESNIRFCVGYSGWTKGQLEDEVDEGSWIVTKIDPINIFENSDETLWKDVLTTMGGEYKIMVNYPLDPSMN